MNKIVKSFVFSFLFLSVTALTIAVFLEKKYEVSRAVQIDAPVERDYILVSNFDNWKEWAPWFQTQPNAEYKIEGIPGTVGSKISWSGKIVGRGTIILQDIQPNQKAQFQLELFTPKHTISYLKIIFNSRNTTSEVVWNESGELPYPEGRWFSHYIQKMKGDNIQQGLDGLKKAAENHPDPSKK